MAEQNGFFRRTARNYWRFMRIAVPAALIQGLLRRGDNSNAAGSWADIAFVTIGLFLAFFVGAAAFTATDSWRTSRSGTDRSWAVAGAATIAAAVIAPMATSDDYRHLLSEPVMWVCVLGAGMAAGFAYGRAAIEWQTGPSETRRDS